MMMNMSKIWRNTFFPVVAMFIAMFLFSCSDEITGIRSGSGELISLSGDINQVYLSRANDNGFADGDVMGVYIVDYYGSKPGTLLNTGNRADNLRETYDLANSKWKSAYDVYFKDKSTAVDIYGYYPFSSPSDVNSYDFEVAKDQSKTGVNGTLGGYEVSDFLWGKAENIAPTKNLIHLSMSHRMSTARVTLVEGSGFNAGEWATLTKNVVISNVIRNSKINLSDGSITAIGSVPVDGTIPYKNGDDFRGIIVPQAVPANTVLFAITVDNTNYSFSKTDAFTYQQGKMYNFTIKVDKKNTKGDYSFSLMDESITAWEADNISHEGKAKEYVVINVPAFGTLGACIKAAGKDFSKIQNLKITGQINTNDFYFMRDSMTNLQALNIKEVTLIDERGNVSNEIPVEGLNGKTSLYSIVLPDKLTKINAHAFYGSSISGSLIIPEGVTEIGSCAFCGCKNLSRFLSLPSSLQKIDDSAFLNCSFTSELILPSNLVYIGAQAFVNCRSLYGSLNLPDNLKFIGRAAFLDCGNLTGSLIIPQSITSIPDCAFADCGFNGTLTLYDGITSIGERAFQYCHFTGHLKLPKNLLYISQYAFSGCNFTGELVLPSKLKLISGWSFEENHLLNGVLEIPSSLQNIGYGAFMNCHSIEKLIIPSSIENIDFAFNNCTSINSIVCKANEPPYITNGTFDGVPKDNFVLEVPEDAVDKYKSATGWHDFKRIAAHHELVCNVSQISAFNAKCTRSLVLNAEGDWVVQSKPDWCSLSAMSGSKKTELTLTVQEMAKGASDRSGNIVFKLSNKDYTTKCTISQYNYEYAEDQVISLQNHSKGNGVNLVFLGDGFDAKDISEGTYMKDIKLEVENFFAIEPYKTYRSYFNVYTAIPVSLESGIGNVNTIKYSKFGTNYSSGSGLICDNDAVFSYALKMPTVTKSNLNKSLIVLIPNSTDYGGVTEMWDDGSAISICPLSTFSYPLDTRGVLQHEAGGHGFGKLGDEYIYYNSFIDDLSISSINHAKSLGWYQNLSLTGKRNGVPWSHLLYSSRYSDIVDIFEGGYFYTRGIYRSEANSCMNNDVPYYSTISREAIVKRIMDYAGETFTFDKFVANDSRAMNSSTMRTRAIQDQYKGSNVFSFQHKPIIHRGYPKIKR